MIIFRCTDAVTAKRAQSVGMAARSIDDAISYTTRAGGRWGSDTQTVIALKRTVRVKSIHIVGDNETLIDITDGHGPCYGLRPLDDSCFIEVSVIQYNQNKKEAA